MSNSDDSIEKQDKCFSCGITGPLIIFCAGNNFSCWKCKVNKNSAEFLTTPCKKWLECDIGGQNYMVRCLGFFYLATKKHSIAELVGATIATGNEAYFKILISFAKQEYTDYGFSPIDFSTVRLMRHCKKQPESLDFWITLCVVYDMGNYMADLTDFDKKYKVKDIVSQKTIKK